MAAYICKLRRQIILAKLLAFTIFIALFLQEVAAEFSVNDIYHFSQRDILNKAGNVEDVEKNVLTRPSPTISANKRYGSSHQLTLANVRNRIRSRIARDTSTGSHNDANCNHIDPDLLKRGVHTYSFNDSNDYVSLLWTEKYGQSLLALTTAEDFLFAAPSHVWISHDFGRTFENVDKKLNGATIMEVNGILRHRSAFKKVILVAYPEDGDPYRTKIYQTSDGGQNFNEVPIPFTISEAIVGNEKNHDWILVRSNEEYTLWFSEDFGSHWVKIHENVMEFKWGTTDQRNEEYIFMSVMDGDKRLENPYESVSFTLYKTHPTDEGHQLTTVKENVYNFGCQGKFLFAATDENEFKNSSKVLHISTDGGETWNVAQVPGITEDMFFSVLDMSEGMIFLHVDDLGDTGSGKLYTSDADGIVYSLSLDKHLFPNGFEQVTDFYKVRSMRGVYLASQLDEEYNVHTMITYDRGGEWDYVDAPIGETCDGAKPCKLQIHNRFSEMNDINVPSFPLSIPQAPGLILAHGNVADSLEVVDPDVFATSDGGYNWTKVLDGPHQYAITNFGGLVVAIPRSEATTDSVLFSYDEGTCWHTYQFSTVPLFITGLLPEPSSKSLNVSIWGFGENDRMWRAITIDFSKVLTKKCGSDDFLSWRPHEKNGLDGCFLGIKESFRKVKPDSFCRVDYKLEVKSDHTSCECKKVDYECDFGFYRDDESDECQPGPSIDSRTDIDICENGDLTKISTFGYRKIPGDECQGGFSPQRSLTDLHKNCNGDSIVKQKHKSTVTVLLILFVILLVIGLSVYVVKGNPPCKPTSFGAYRYSELNQGDKEEAEFLDISPGPDTYHDDSDEDMLA